jgi:hydrogenase maturation protein HypF
LTERAIARLENGGFRVYWHQRIPPNDGGIALGQVVASAYLNNGEMNRAMFVDTNEVD